MIPGKPRISRSRARLSELHAERALLEGRLLSLERAIEAQKHLPLVAAAGESWPEAADLAAGVDGLLAQLATVNTELAAMRSALGRT
jgi:hypothetical protein